MEIILQCVGFTASDHLEQLLHDKLGKLTRHTDKVMNAHVTLTKGPEAELKNNYCEIRLEVPGNDLFVKKNSTSFEHSVVECVDALHQMLEKNKEKELAAR